MSKVTMDDIAAALNMSKSTVSKAINNAYGISDETRNIIIHTALQMEYNFSKIHNPENTTTKNTLVLVDDRSMSDPNISIPIINGIESALYSKNLGMNIIPYVVDIPTNNMIIDNIMNKNCIGCIVMGNSSPEMFDTISKITKPVITIDPRFPVMNSDVIMAENFYGCYQAVEYLHDCGHENIAFMGSTDYSLSFYERHSGYLYAMNKLGLEAKSLIYKYDSLSVPFNRSQFNDYSSSAKFPCAILCGNDMTAFLACNIMKGMGISVPNDVSILGFDNAPISIQSDIKITTLAIPKNEIGKIAVDLMLWRKENKDHPFMVYSIKTKFIERNSVLNLKKRKQ